MTNSRDEKSRRNPNQKGFATAAVLVLLLITVVTGAFMLKSSRHQSATAANYFQARSASFAAQSGLEAALATLEANPTESVQLINNYLADPTKAWLLGGTTRAGSATWVNLGSNQQQYSARILAFDPTSRMVKLAADGRGPGGSVSTVYGVFQLGGTQELKPTFAKFAWYMAGDARNVDMVVDVTGSAYFGGDIHFNNGATGSIFRGPVKVALGAGNTSSFDARVTFFENAYFQTPIRTQGGGLYFQKNLGFERDISTDVDLQVNATGQIAYFNSNINGGNAAIDMHSNRIVHNGRLNMARTKNVGSVTPLSGTIDIQSNLGMNPPGAEQEVTLNLATIPSNKKFTLASLGFGASGNTNGPDLTNAYNAALASGKLYRNYLVLTVSSGLNFSSVSNNILRGKFVFDITSNLTVNANFPISDPTSVCLISVKSGGSILGFGGPGLFRGYMNVSGTGSVIYQWGAAAEFRGAIHHVSPTASFQMNSSPGPLRLVFDPTVFDDLAGLGVMIPPGQSVPPPIVPQIQLVDTRIRPFFFSRYF